MRLVLAALLLAATALAAQVAIPELRERVTDTTGTLSASDKAQLEAPLAALETQKGAQIALLIVPGTGAETIEQYAVRAFEQWKLGRQGVDDGILLVVAKDDRTVRIEVGYGLEGAVPDVAAHRIIQEYLVPRFRAGDFVGGLQAAVGALAGLVQGEALPAPMSDHAAGASLPSGGLDESLPLIVMLGMLGVVIRKFIAGLPVLMRMLVMPAALFALARVWMGTSLVVAGIVAGLGLVIALLPAMSGSYARGGRTGRWGGSSGGGWGGGSSRSSGGGGGFSGGGGRSGGGGASGRW